MHASKSGFQVSNGIQTFFDSFTVPFIFLIAFVLIILATFLENKINNKKPKIKIEAKVLKVDKKYANYIYFGRRGGYNSTPRYLIKFEFIDGRSKTFSVPRDSKSEKIAKGDFVTLTLQGSRFISFKKKHNNKFN